MISQHHTLKVQRLHQPSLYNSCYFEFYLRMHRLRQMQDCGEPGLSPGPTRQCRAAATCLLQNTFFFLSTQLGKRLSETTPTVGENRTSELRTVSRELFPLCGNHYPRGTSQASAAHGPRNIATRSKIMNFPLTGMSWTVTLPCCVYITPALSGGVERFVFFSGKHSVIHYLPRTKEEEVRPILPL